MRVFVGIFRFYTTSKYRTRVNGIFIYHIIKYIIQGDKNKGNINLISIEHFNM